MNNNKGLTLIELLVVISIILVLMGIILPSIGAYRKKAERTKAAALINSLSIAIDNYKADFKRFPNVEGSSDYYNQLNKELYLRLTGDINENFSIDSADKHSYLAITIDNLDFLNDTSLPYFIDPFGNRIGYYPYPLYHNRTRYNLWSKGQDGETSENAEMGNDEDDINNWR